MKKKELAEIKAAERAEAERQEAEAESQFLGDAIRFRAASKETVRVAKEATGAYDGGRVFVQIRGEVALNGMDNSGKPRGMACVYYRES
ncbi:MAG: hypothetical protein LBT20_01295 [Clostridiales bacterium]|jgi:hypothetical protein|nr:hypothetical protein [Clostridiales bacterium]